MKCLITGASGFIGNQLCRLLDELEVEYVTLGRNKPLFSRSEHLACDLLDTADFESLLRPVCATHLIHLAWYTEHGKYWHSPLNSLWHQASMALLKSFISAGGCSVVMAGTCAEYDWRYGFCSEALTPLRSASQYSEFKSRLLADARNVCDARRIPLAWGRIFFCYGPGENASRLIPALAGVFRGNKPAFGVNLNHYRDFIYVTDVARAFLTLLRNQASGVFNISSGEPLRVRTLVEAIASQERADPGLVTRLPPARREDTPFLVGDNRKLAHLGWSPQVPLLQGISHINKTLQSVAN